MQTETESRPRHFGKSTLVTNQFLVAAKKGQSAKYEAMDYVCFTRKALEDQRNAWLSQLRKEIEGLKKYPVYHQGKLNTDDYLTTGYNEAIKDIEALLNENKN